MKLKTGQSVKVKNGVSCPDDPEFDLSGWQGRISDINEDEKGKLTIGIAWDSKTLEEMPERYIEISEAEGLDWSSMYLPASEVDSAKERDSRQNTDKMREEIEKRSFWLDMGEEGKRIRAVINSAKSDDDSDLMEAWERHFEKNLDFPFEGIVDEAQRKGRLRVGDKLKVLGIEIADELYGIIVSCRKGRERHDLPLVDLAAADENSGNAQHVQDYRVWFSNR